MSATEATSLRGRVSGFGVRAWLIVLTVAVAIFLANFLRDVCGCTGQWKMQAFIDRTVEEIRAKVGKKRVICGLSGGVDVV